MVSVQLSSIFLQLRIFYGVPHLSPRQFLIRLIFHFLIPAATSLRPNSIRTRRNRARTRAAKTTDPSPMLSSFRQPARRPAAPALKGRIGDSPLLSPSGFLKEMQQLRNQHFNLESTAGWRHCQPSQSRPYCV